jgi:hypothetical protein
MSELITLTIAICIILYPSFYLLGKFLKWLTTVDNSNNYNQPVENSTEPPKIRQFHLPCNNCPWAFCESCPWAKSKGMTWEEIQRTKFLMMNPHLSNPNKHKQM